VDAAGTLYVGYWEVHGAGGGVARSRDGGATFELLEGIAGQPVKALSVAPSDPGSLVAGTRDGVFRSKDAGRTWARISPEGDAELKNIDSIAIDPGDPDVIYAGTWHLPWKTTDGGRTWKGVHTGMIDDSDVMTLTIDRRSSRIVYATACSGIYRSADAALRWTKLRGIPGSSRRTRAFAQHPTRLDTFYAGTTEGLWTTDDGGVSWRLLTSQKLVVNALMVGRDGTVLVGSEGAGVLRSDDGGRTFSASNEGFSERFVSSCSTPRAGGSWPPSSGTGSTAGSSPPRGRKGRGAAWARVSRGGKSSPWPWRGTRSWPEPTTDCSSPSRTAPPGGACPP
jgi:photosystem II stability/assembly factor-like uncharacterized protein